MGSSEANELAPRFIDEVAPGGYIGVWALSVLKRSKISSASMSGLLPVAKRFWSRIVTGLLRKIGPPNPRLELDFVGRTIVRCLPAGLDDATDLGRAPDRFLIAQSHLHTCWLKTGTRPTNSGKSNWFPAGFLSAVWNHINAHQLQDSHGDAVRNLIGRVAMIEMVGPVLTRALQPFPVPVRTLDAIHLAAIEFVRAQKQSVQLASYDERLLAAARVLGIPAWSASQ
jgi:hypothetical protein